MIGWDDAVEAKAVVHGKYILLDLALFLMLAVCK